MLNFWDLDRNPHIICFALVDGTIVCFIIFFRIVARIRAGLFHRLLANATFHPSTVPHRGLLCGICTKACRDFSCPPSGVVILARTDEEGLLFCATLTT